MRTTALNQLASTFEHTALSGLDKIWTKKDPGLREEPGPRVAVSVKGNTQTVSTPARGRPWTPRELGPGKPQGQVRVVSTWSGPHLLRAAGERFCPVEIPFDI